MLLLPPDTTDVEVLELIQRLWSEYLPNEDIAFLEHLTPQDARTMLQIISTRDPIMQENIWKEVEWHAHEIHINMESLLQHLHILKQQYAEAIDSASEEKSIEDMLIQLG